MVSKSYQALYVSLKMRRRPEDIARLILDLPELSLSPETQDKLKLAADGSLANNGYGFSSMPDTFSAPIGCQNQFSKAQALFPGVVSDLDSGDLPEHADRLIQRASPVLGVSPQQLDFHQDRLNRLERKNVDLELSKRQYNKRFRFLRRLEEKRNRLAKEIKKQELTYISQSKLAFHIASDDFYVDARSAAFIAYFVARSNLRSEFTTEGQERPYDEIAHQLWQDCEASESTHWWAVSHVYLEQQTLAHLSDEEKGRLLGQWYAILVDISSMLKDVWLASDIARQTMIVRRGNDSTTWNITAGAWNKARDAWFQLLFSLGMQEIIEMMCPGKVLRLMAGDVVARHFSEGGSLDPDTQVWCDLPLPWEVLSGEVACSKHWVEKVCQRHGVDSVKKAWVAPQPKQAIAAFKPTPELVHGVSVSHPGLARFLKKQGFFSGKLL